jgi:hypothetical protein
MIEAGGRKVRTELERSHGVVHAQLERGVDVVTRCCALVVAGAVGTNGGGSCEGEVGV